MVDLASSLRLLVIVATLFGSGQGADEPLRQCFPFSKVHGATVAKLRIGAELLAQLDFNGANR